MLELRDRITRTSIQLERNKLFVFGDNLLREGFGGQAKEMRGEPNTIGIITKRKPTMEECAFLTDDFFEVWAKVSGYDFLRLFLHRGTIVWPSAGIGTGLAQLPSRAPLIFEAIELLRDALREFCIKHNWSCWEDYGKIQLVRTCLNCGREETIYDQ